MVKHQKDELEWHHYITDLEAQEYLALLTPATSPPARVVIPGYFTPSHYLSQVIICLESLFVSSHYLSQVIICLKSLFIPTHYPQSLIINLFNPINSSTKPIFKSLKQETDLNTMGLKMKKIEIKYLRVIICLQALCSSSLKF